jgi:hypothetical protein
MEQAATDTWGPAENKEASFSSSLFCSLYKIDTTPSIPKYKMF